MTALLEAVILIPIAAGLIAVVSGATSERTVESLFMTVGFAASIALVVGELTGHHAQWRAYAPTPWTATLAALALACTVVAVVQAGSVAARAAASIAGGTAVATAFAPDTLWLALPLVVSTIAIGVALGTDRGSRLRAFAPFALSDVLTLAGLVVAGRNSVSFAAVASHSGAAWLVLAGGAVRLVAVSGLTPARPLEVALGGIARVQGALLISLAVVAGGAHMHAALIAGAVACAAVWAGSLAGNARGGWIALGGALVLTGFGVGGSAGVWGAVAALVAATIASVVDASQLRSFPALPLAALVPAFALAGGGLLRLAAANVAYVPAFVAVAAAAIGAATMLQPREPEHGAGWLRGLAGVPAVLAAGGLALLPRYVVSHGLARVGLDLGVGAPLGSSHEVIPNTLAVFAGVAAVAGFVVGGDHAPRRQGAAVAPVWARWWAAAPGDPVPPPEHEPPVPGEGVEDSGSGIATTPQRATTITRSVWVWMSAEIAACALAVWLLVEAGGHGWL